MVTYYISYGEPQRGGAWRAILIVLAILLALALIAVIAYGAYALATNEDDSGPSDAAVPLAEALVSLYGDNTNTVFLVDTSKSINESLELVREALLAVALPHIDPSAGRPAEDSFTSLAPFTEVPESLPTLVSLHDAQEAREWLTQVDQLTTMDHPAYIYDAVGAAHDMLFDHHDDVRDNVIVLLTDGGDGGFGVIDPTKAELCGPDINHAPGEICNPVLKTIPIDLDQLVPCPQDVAVAPGEMCNPVPVATAGENINVYHRVNRADVRPCPPELGGASIACIDITTAYQTFHPDKVQPCPHELEEPGKTCIELKSELTQEGLLAMLATSDVPHLKVHTIGLGAEADHATLKALAEATGGKYIYAER